MGDARSRAVLFWPRAGAPPQRRRATVGKDPAPHLFSVAAWAQKMLCILYSTFILITGHTPQTLPHAPAYSYTHSAGGAARNHASLSQGKHHPSASWPGHRVIRLPASTAHAACGPRNHSRGRGKPPSCPTVQVRTVFAALIGLWSQLQGVSRTRRLLSSGWLARSSQHGFAVWCSLMRHTGFCTGGAPWAGLRGAQAWPCPARASNRTRPPRTLLLPSY